MYVITKSLLLLLCVKIVCNLYYERYTPVVEVGEGKLRGIHGRNGQNQYYAIPYATSKRFQPPTPPKRWSGIFHAVNRFVACAQAMGPIHFGSEDCLNLDVYTPEHSTGQKLPVLVFFHGGAYFTGVKSQYDPEFLVEKNIIVVLPQYRLGVLGFLCLNNVANLGLKDQLAALKWVQRNIAAFGGDPNNVTISGQSAGAASSSMHLLSKRSKGLFNNAILISGVALTPWAFNVDPLTPAFEDAAKIKNKPVRNEIEVYNTFLNASLEELLTATQDILTDPKYFKYSPCGDANLTDPFFHDTPYNIIKSGDFNKVPMIIGSTDLEGMLFYGLTNDQFLQYLDDSFPHRLPSTFSWCSDQDKMKIASELRSYYFGEKRIKSKASVQGGIDMYSDWVAYSAIEAFSQLMAKHSGKPVYQYLFSYEGERNYFKNGLDRGFGIKGVAHCDDLHYMFKLFGLIVPLNDLDKLIIQRYTTMLANFIKFGDPTPTESVLLPLRWPATTANRSQVMRIDNPLSVSDTPYHVRGQFYLRLLCEHGLSGYVPCDSAMRCNLEL